MSENTDWEADWAREVDDIDPSVPVLEVAELSKLEKHHIATHTLLTLMEALILDELTNFDARFDGIGLDDPTRENPLRNVRVFHIAGSAVEFWNEWGIFEGACEFRELDAKPWQKFIGAPVGVWSYDLIIMEGSRLNNNLESFLTPYFEPGHEFIAITIDQIRSSFSLHFLQNLYYNLFSELYPESGPDRRNHITQAFNKAHATLRLDTLDAQEIRIHQLIGRGVAAGSSRF
jgi:hypothetical protein